MRRRATRAERKRNRAAAAAYRARIAANLIPVTHHFDRIAMEEALIKAGWLRSGMDHSNEQIKAAYIRANEHTISVGGPGFPRAPVTGDSAASRIQQSCPSPTVEGQHVEPTDSRRDRNRKPHRDAA